MANKQYASLTISSAVAIALVWPFAVIGKGSAPMESNDEAELRIQPVARVEMKKVDVKSDGKPRDGAAVYKTVCVVCHAAGVAGAPKTGDKAAWAPRIAAGNATMLKNATNGKNAMPPRGGAADLTDGELKAAVDYLVGQAR